MNMTRVGGPLVSALPIGLGSATKQLALEVIYRKRHLAGMLKARKYRGQRGMAMHLGCGNRIKDGWVNIDLNPAADLTLDLRERLPFPDDSFSIIYSEHFLEHLTILTTSLDCRLNAIVFLNQGALILLRCPTAKKCSDII
jgi:hypothetical protein